MLSTKQTGAKVFRRKYRRDSGIYSDSGPSEVELPLKCHDDSPENFQQEENHRDNKCSSETTLSRGVAGKAECNVTDFNQDYIDTESVEVESEGKSIVNKQVDADTNLQNGEYSDSSKDQTCLLKLYGQDSDSQNQKDATQKFNHETPNYNPETINSYILQDENLDDGGLQKSHTYESINSLVRPSLVSSKLHSGQENLLNQADIAVINRCDGLIHHLQDSTQKYHKLEDSYQKNRKLFYILAIVNLVLIFCVIIFVPLLLFASRKSDSPNENGSSNGETVVSDNSKESAKQYSVCFNCSELGRDSTLSLETLVEVSQSNGKCCFKSIISVLKSQNWNFQNALDESTNRVKSRISEIDRRLLQLEIGSAPDTNAIIGNILQTLAPKEKTALYLKSPRGTPFGKDYDSYNKLRWTSDDSSAILRGGVELDGNGLNIKVKSEAYYFIYTKIQFRHKERAPYNQALPLSYLVYRKRGSISTYVHEAKLNCVFNDMTQEHSSTSEMVLHLNREDEIFISIDDSDKDFLTSDPGAHMIGLFEI